MKVIYKAESPTTYSYVLGNEFLEGRAGNTVSLAGIHMRLAADLTFSFSNGAWAIEAKNRFLPYKHKNGMKRRLDLAIKPIGDHEHELVSPHGIRVLLPQAPLPLGTMAPEFHSAAALST